MMDWSSVKSSQNASLFKKIRQLSMAIRDKNLGSSITLVISTTNQLEEMFRFLVMQRSEYSRISNSGRYYSKRMYHRPTAHYLIQPVLSVITKFKSENILNMILHPTISGFLHVQDTKGGARLLLDLWIRGISLNQNELFLILNIKTHKIHYLHYIYIYLVY